MKETKIVWLSIKSLQDVVTHKSYLVSIKREDALFSMVAYVNMQGEWVDGCGEKITGEVYAIANLPDPMPLIG